MASADAAPAPPTTTAEEVRPLLEEAVRARDSERADELVRTVDGGDAVWVVAGLAADDLEELVRLVPPETAARILAVLPESQAGEALDGLAPERAAEILDELDTEQQAWLLDELEDHEADAILERLAPEDAADLRFVLSHDDDTLGYVLDRDFLAFPLDATIGTILDDLRENADDYSDLEVQYTYVVDADERLVGVLNLRSLLMRKPETRVSKVMVPDPVRLTVTDPISEAQALFDRSNWLAVPVVDAAGRLLGIAKRTSVEAMTTDEQGRTLLRLSGIVGGEELRSMPFGLRSFRRLSWLSVNIVLNVVAASVIAVHQDTLAKIIALAVFLPIISDMSGCSGNQAVAVSLRELTLGVTRPGEILRVLAKELSLGAFNGVVLGTLLGCVAGFWQGNAWLGLVVGGALAINTALACCVGGLVPLVLHHLRQDPALASGPLLTTITDLCGFLLVLTMASRWMPLLAG